MSLPRTSLLAAVALATLSACGGPEPTTPVELGLAITSRALEAEVETVRLSLFAGVEDCTVIELSGPNVLGVYQRTFAVLSGAGQGGGEILSIVPDTYTAVAWGFDGAGRAVAFGCQATPLIIEEGKRASVDLTLDTF
ncbi:MAG: hypothetical protein KC933_27800 [Myxococcales bacterium]|nr:hypothetical protein [Myxococcales bacterium]MCB9646480.1 hypothetical protein [Deltaproteobacteria bacterium]